MSRNGKNIDEASLTNVSDNRSLNGFGVRFINDLRINLPTVF